MDTVAEVAEIEATRYARLPRFIKVLFILFSTAGVGLAVFNVFGLSIGGQVMINVAYYYLLMAIFSSSAFLILPARKRDKRLPWYDIMAAVLTFGSAIYFFTRALDIADVGWVPPPSNFDLALAIILFLSALEGGRRMGGPVYLIVCGLLGIYPLIASHMPGILWGQGYSFPSLMGLQVFGSGGLLGLPSKTLGDLLIGFLVFAAIMIASGAGTAFLNIALALLGRFRGGPAKVCVAASALFGTCEGSVFASIASIGSITIPTMKRIGYSAEYAGAIEACASTGGMLMPPVMGAAAFVMCMFLGIEYRVVMVAAALPAILYYFGLLMQVDFYAAKTGLKGLPREELPSLTKTIKQSWPYGAVLVFLIWGFIYMRWEAMTPFYASGMMIVLSYCRRETMLTPRKIIDALVGMGRLITQTMAIILPIGLIICGLTSTGVTTSFTAAVVHIGGGNALLILAMGAIACYILGMAGMLVSAYIFLAVSMAPAAIQVGGLDPIAVHLFIVYYVMLANITLPVAAAAFLAATIAKASPMGTALRAMRLGIVIYFIPFFFVFNPALILRGSPLATVYLFALAAVGIVFIAAALEGYLIKVGKLGLWQRVLLGVAGILICFPEWSTTYIGFAIALVTIVPIIIRKKLVQKKTTVIAQANPK